MDIQEIADNSRNAYIMVDRSDDYDDEDIPVVFDVLTGSFVSHFPSRVGFYVHPIISYLMTSSTPFGSSQGIFVCYSRLRLWYYNYLFPPDISDPNFVKCGTLLDAHSQPHFDDSPMTVFIQRSVTYAHQNRNVLLIRYIDYDPDVRPRLRSAVVMLPERYRFTDVSTWDKTIRLEIIDSVTGWDLTTRLTYCDSNPGLEHRTNYGYSQVDIGLRIV